MKSNVSSAGDLDANGTTIATVAAAPVLPIFRCATDVLIYLARVFLTTDDLFAFGASHIHFLEITQRCDLALDRVIGLGALIRDRSEANALFDSLSTENQQMMMRLFENEQIKVKVLPKEFSLPPTPRSTSLHKYAIGRITAIHTQDRYGHRLLKHVRSHLHLLSPSIRFIKLFPQMNLPIGWVDWCFPPGLTRLHLGSQFRVSLESMVFPPHLRELIIDHHYDGDFTQMNLPSNLHTLRLNGEYMENLHMSFALPLTLTELHLPSAPNSSLANLKLPEGLLTLRFVSYFHHASFEYLKLPNSLTHLNLGTSFKESLMRSTWIPPSSLTRLQCRSDCHLRGGEGIDITNAYITYDSSPNVLDLSSSSSFATADRLFRRSCVTSVCALSNSNLASVISQYHSLTSLELTGYNTKSITGWSAPPPQLRELVVGLWWEEWFKSISLPATLTRRLLSFIHVMSFHHCWNVSIVLRTGHRKHNSHRR